MIRFSLGILTVLLICACSENDIDKKDWPQKLKDLEVGIKVTHSADTVYATINDKDPEKWGKYQLKFTTTVEAISEDLELVEFGGYIWENGKWQFKSIYDRPFNKDEFDKWYGAKDGKISLESKYADHDNWMTKSDVLNGNVYRGLWYFIGKKANGEKVVGVKEIVCVMKLKK